MTRSVAASETAVPSGPPGLREAWLVSAGHALTHWYPATFYLLLPIIGNEFGLSFSQIGLLMTCQALAGALANVPGGILVDTVGRKGVLMAVSLFWVGFPYLLMGFTHSYALLLGCVVMVGLGNSLWHPTAIPALAARYPQRKGLVLSWHGMGGNAGDALAPVVVGSMLAVMSWRDVVVANVVPGVMMSLLLLGMLGSLRLGPRRQATAGAATGQSLAQYVGGLRELLRNRSLLLLSTGSAFRSMTQNALMTFLPLYLAREMHQSTLWVGISMFVLQAAGFAAAPVAGHLSDRYGRKGVMASTMALTALVLLSMALLSGTRAFVLLIAVLGFVLYAIRPVIQAWLLDTTPKNMGGSSIGLLFGAQSLGASVAPAIGGAIADRFGLGATFVFMALTIACANVLVMAMPATVKEQAGAGGRP